MNDIKFPITLDSFCEMAERIAGQPVSDDWREVYRSVVPIINDSYRLGLSGEPRKPFDVESVVRKVAHLGMIHLRVVLRYPSSIGASWRIHAEKTQYGVLMILYNRLLPRYHQSHTITSRCGFAYLDLLPCGKLAVFWLLGRNWFPHKCGKWRPHLWV